MFDLFSGLYAVMWAILVAWLVVGINYLVKGLWLKYRTKVFLKTVTQVLHQLNAILSLHTPKRPTTLSPDISELLRKFEDDEDEYELIDND